MAAGVIDRNPHHCQTYKSNLQDMKPLMASADERQANMQYGKLSGNDHINARIYDSLGKIHPSDLQSFIRKFRSQSDRQCFHTYRELILGAHLITQGWNLRYEQRIDGKTPDWAVLNDGEQVVEIIDVATLHQRAITEMEITRGLSSVRYWEGWITIPPDHIHQKLQQKANSYAELAEQKKIPYVVALFGEFTASVDVREVSHVLHELHGGVFSDAPTLAGCIYFRELLGEYEFSYFENPHAVYRSVLLQKA